ncbi:MAG: hypothetical protein J6D30_05485 [Clostridia bacterium]|nr:hypothetical protein [Clostridia bacterium]
MKKMLCMAAILLGGACLLSGCDFLESYLPSLEESVSSKSVEESSLEQSSSSEHSQDNSQENSSSSENEGARYAYNDFTPEEKALFERYIGEVVPFIPNNEYYVEGYYDVDDYEHGMNFYTFGNTIVEFEAYLETAFVGYEKTDTYLDEYDDLWHVFEKGDIVIDVAFYYTAENERCVDLYVYSSLSTDLDDSSGSASSETDSSDSSIADGESDLLTNHGKGLPTGQNGVYNVDFTKAKYVKDVTDQGYYLDGCPTLSTANANPAVLVIPVEFSDATAASKGYDLTRLNKAFNGAAGETDYHSVREYYHLSSYGKLDLDITVLDQWFKPKYMSSWYVNQTMETDGAEEEIGDVMIMDEALSYLESRMDLSRFDSDGNGTIDAVVMINTLDIDSDSESMFYWAYRYWNTYMDDDGYCYEYDGVYANDYLWASYQFLFESEDVFGNTTFTDTSAMNTYTYIHEFGHVLGADDYYDTTYTGAPMDGYDVMDSMMGDHNAFTKFNYGWLNSSRLVVAENSVTLTLEAFSENGDTILIANDWDENLGAYQEYYIVTYYTNDGLNTGAGGYFRQEGIVVYHVNATLYKEVLGNDVYYDVYNNNTDVSDESGYGTQDNLIELVEKGWSSYVFTQGDSLPAVENDQGNTIAYTFTVDKLTDTTATLTFTKTA